MKASNVMSIILYIMILGLVMTNIIEFWGMTIAVMLLTIAIIINKISSDETIKTSKMRNEKMIKSISETIESISEKLSIMRYELNKSMFRMENKIKRENNEMNENMEIKLKGIIRKIIDLENKLNTTKSGLKDEIENVERYFLLKRKMDGGYPRK